LQLLANLGYTYLPPAEALRSAAGGWASAAGRCAVDWLRAHNQVRHKGQTVPFTDANIQEAVRKLKAEPSESLLKSNEKLYELLTLGASLPQTVAGDTRSFNLKYIDWKHPERNVYHVSDEFPVMRSKSSDCARISSSSSTIRSWW
jgi:type I restriction enzyme R subunit